MNKNMEYIYKIYQEGGFSKAAKALYISQPALSAIVRRTERQLHTTLFDRSQSPVRLTTAGEYYIRCIERIQAIEREMEGYFADLSGGSRGTLAIGSGAYYCTYVLPGLIRRFQAQYPQVQISLMEDISDQRTQKLSQGQLDFMVDVNELRALGLESQVIARENMILAVPASFAGNEKLRGCRLTFEEVRQGRHLNGDIPCVDISAFRDDPFIFLKPGNHSHDLLKKLCRLGGFEPRQAVISLDQLLTAYYMACEGAGITVLRDTTLLHVAYTPSLFFYKLPDQLSQRSVYLSYAKSAKERALIRLFLDFLRSNPGPFELLEKEDT